jgi:hypothetical protein
VFRGHGYKGNNSMEQPHWNREHDIAEIDGNKLIFSL